MKKFCFGLYVTLISSVCLSNDIDFQKDLDFGDVPVGNSRISNIRMLPLKITNNSNDNYIIEQMIVQNNYADSILYRGNVMEFLPGYIVKYLNGPVVIKPNSSFLLNVIYHSVYVDDVSKSGVKLSKTVVFYYRHENEQYLSEDTVTMFARSVESTKVEASGQKYNFYVCPSGLGTVKYNFYYVNFINNTSNTLRIDSTLIEIKGQNFKATGLFNSDGLPDSIVKPNDFVRFKFSFELKNFENSVAKVKYFATEINGSGKQFTAEDSAIAQYMPLVETGRIVLYNRTLNIYPGNKNQQTLYVLSCTLDDLFLDSIYIKPNNMSKEFYIPTDNNDTFPISLNKTEIKTFAFEYTSTKIGTREAQVCGDFRSQDGTIYTRCIEVLITVIDPSDVNQPSDNKNTLRVYPNPADNYLKIYVDENSGVSVKSIEIYDIYGRQVYKSGLVFDNGFIINTSGLSCGSYIGLFKLSDGSIQQTKIMIVR
jgi:hypothetical protein